MKKLSSFVTVAGQIPVSALSAIQADGYRTVINHRPDDEEPGQPTSAELAQEAHRLGLDYVWIPVRGLPDPAAVEATDAVLQRASDDAPVLLFCRSGMRSSAAWAMAECARGADADAVRAAATAAGYDLSRLPL